MGHEAAVLRSIEGATMSLLGVDARGKVNGLLFELAVEQRYRNATGTNVEVVYTFPVPWGATLLDLEVRLGDKLLTGVVVEKRTAEAQYEAAIDKGDTAIMLERAADGLLRSTSAISCPERTPRFAMPMPRPSASNTAAPA